MVKRFEEKQVAIPVLATTRQVPEDRAAVFSEVVVN
jgi:hypothetical protein